MPKSATRLPDNGNAWAAFEASATPLAVSDGWGEGKDATLRFIQHQTKACGDVSP